MANRRPRHVPDYDTRKKNLLKYINEISEGQEYTILELNEPFGKTLNVDYDYIVVSPETHPVALKINQLRSEKNMKEIEVVRLILCLPTTKYPYLLQE